MRQIDIINFVDAVTNPRVHFKTLTNILPMYNSRGSVIMYAGNQSVVFKVSIDSKCYALKCLELPHKELTEEAKSAMMFISSQDRDYLVSSQHLEKELSIYTLDKSFEDLSVELRPWIDGTTLGSKMMDLIDIGDSKGMDLVIDDFLKLASKLLEEDFAHGDLKPDNILITNSGKMLLIDFGSVYINQYHSSPNKEVGTVGYRHPLRDKYYYNRRIDDYPIAIILSTMLVSCRSAMLFDRYTTGEFSIFSPANIIDERSEVFTASLELFKDDIIERCILSMLKSTTPALEMFAWWINKLIEKRAISPIAECSKIMFDSESLKYGLCKSDDTTTFPAIFDDAVAVFDGLFAVKIGSLWAIIDSSAKPLTEFVYRDIKSLDNNLIAAMMGRKYTVLKRDFTALAGYIYDDINNYHSGFAVVKRDGKYGYINCSGMEVVEAKYDFAKNIRNGIASVRVGSEYIDYPLINLIDSSIV